MAVAFLFPGQGSQAVGMCRDLYERSDAARKVFDDADKAIGFSLSDLCFYGPEEELELTVNSQPAILTASMACFEAAREMLGDKFPKALAMAGHSLGEYSALTAAGALRFSDAVKLTAARGKAMHEAGLLQPGAMAAVIAMDDSLLEDFCKDTGTYIANLNCPGQTVISGSRENIEQACRTARPRGAKLARQLKVSGAFHSPLMTEAKKRFEPLIDSAQILAADTPVVANTTAKTIFEPQSIKTELRDQICGCVRWTDTIKAMADMGIDTFIEFGPGEVLTGMVKRMLPNARLLNVRNCEDISRLADT